MEIPVYLKKSGVNIFFGGQYFGGGGISWNHFWGGVASPKLFFSFVFFFLGGHFPPRGWGDRRCDVFFRGLPFFPYF